ncbi:alkaline phosphatase family protein [Georgenia yuyongxinii]|uniref:Alkaline phosphatase family protein n=1 Tax=Georgenia yuyongxinii TaxID=2589797 RepID=A0A552WL56_9MICO|nr:alkaline phosphatase family protein [Georgenia yuyongxinii]TRW43510.1 alkaline phosphatase family protein [Georgenia yuyongxinii]
MPPGARAPEQPPRLLLGPLLRYVDADSATVWVETDRPCLATLHAGGRQAVERTWSVHGHHYALLVLTGLPEAAVLPYEVRLDGVRAWPAPDQEFAPSVIRTIRHDERLRLAFGSCRRSAGHDAEALRRFGADALVALAGQMATAPHEQWPDALFLAGDQIYADDPSPELTARLKAAHRGTGARDADRWDADTDHDGGRREVRGEVHDFEEYTWLYQESWSQPAVRWLLSTVPSCMILDDHDLRDDWNTSCAWRERMERQPWWRDRVTGAFASYWVYQHLGNLSPRELAEDEVLAVMHTTDDDATRTRVLDEFAWRTDAEPDTARWSYVRDLGGRGLGIRLVVVDSRCSRRLDPDARAMVDDAEWAWVLEHALTPPGGERIGHLLLGTTLPAFLPAGIHHLEGWSEAVASHRAWGPVAAWLAERLRRAIDLEHWAAFRASFDQLVDLLRRAVEAPQPPSSILLLSGDIHSSYTARVRLRDVRHPGTAVHQLTMSPFRNPMHRAVRLAHQVIEWPPVSRTWRGLARLAGVADAPVAWRLEHGPWFTNGIMTLSIDGIRATVEMDRAEVRHGRQELTRLGVAPLAP